MMPERRRIFLVNRYFYPDSSATSQMLSDLAFFLAERGWDVNIVTSAGAYSGPVSQLSRHENVRGVTVHRVGPLGVRPNSLAMRALASVRLHWAFALEIFRRTRAGDVLVIKTDPPLLSVSMATLLKFRKLVQINWLQDLYPEVAIELGVSGESGGAKNCHGNGAIIAP